MSDSKSNFPHVNPEPKSSKEPVEFGSPEVLDFATAELAGSDNKPTTEFEKLRASLQDAESRALRYQAELDNFRRRTRREADEQLKYASLNLISGILEAVDNLERALLATPENVAQSSLGQGVQMVAAQILETLRASGCRKIEAVGQVFDPKLHQAVLSQANDSVPANQVVQELRTGYQLYERLVRPTQVIVSTGPSAK